MGTIQTPSKIHRLDAPTLEQIAGADKSARVRRRVVEEELLGLNPRLNGELVEATPRRA